MTIKPGILPEKYAWYGDVATLPEMAIRSAELEPDRIAYTQAFRDETLSPDGNSRKWIETPNYKMLERVRNIADFFVDHGLIPGDFIYIKSNNRPEWDESELATWVAGGSVGGGYPSDTPDLDAVKLDDLQPRFAIVANQEALDRLLYLQTNKVTVPQIEDRPPHPLKLNLEKIITLDNTKLPRAGKYWKLRNQLMQYEDVVEHQSKNGKHTERYKDLLPNRIANVVYTSGTTGSNVAPKGAVWTHTGVKANVDQIINSQIWEGLTKVFSMVPTAAHAFMRSISHFLIGTYGWQIFPSVVDRESSKLSAEVKRSLKLELRLANAHIVIVVPLILEKMRPLIIEEIRKQLLGDKVEAVVNHNTEYMKKTRGSVPLSHSEKLTHNILETTGLSQKVQAKIREKIAGKDFKFFIAGGAPTSKRELHFYRGGLDMAVCAGYGSTESNCATHINRVDNWQEDSLGYPLDDSIEQKISEDMELLLRGPNVAQQYFKRPEATAKTWTNDGFLHTRDICRIGEGGFVYRKGRMDDIGVHANGKNINLNAIEERIKEQLSYDVQPIAFCDGQEFVVVLLSVNDKLLSNLNNELSDIWKEIQEKVNPGLKYHERVCNFACIHELTLGKGLNVAAKAQRLVIGDHYKILLKLLQSENRLENPGADRMFA